MIPIICLFFIAVGGYIILRSTQQHDRDLDASDDGYGLSSSQMEDK